ncbi:MAG TPA: helix-hairpin-helix domain-containing protein [Candidatus Eisenbacteria bacterium]|nr:helix-hairpin-helix domain-containing protein [Candidatus Eisenbacteria bacterium]
MKRFVIGLALAVLGAASALPVGAQSGSPGMADTTGMRASGALHASRRARAPRTHKPRKATARRTRATSARTRTRTHHRSTLRTTGTGTRSGMGTTGTSTGTAGAPASPRLDSSMTRPVTPPGGTPPSTPEGAGTGATGATGTANAPLDLNTASRDQLLTLPGVSAEIADRIVASRPFTGTSDLVSRGILTQAQYTLLQSRVTVTTTPH